MERINSIDIIRGACIWIMIYGHLLDWWIIPEDTWFKVWLFAFLEPIGATGFIFISGISTTLAYKNNLNKINSVTNIKIAKYAFFFRALFILLIAFIMNSFSFFMLNGSIFDIWSWLVLQTIGFSLIFSWPFLSSSKVIRILLGLILIILNQFVLALLLPYHGQANFFGVLFHFLFNPISQYIILIYFGVFLIGTSIGDYIFNFNILKDHQERKNLFDSSFYKKSLIFGSIAMCFGFFFAFPNFLIFNTISSIIYSLGLILLLITILISKELSGKPKLKRSYRYLFFYSYYSFTIYLGHYILYYLFLDQLNWIIFLIVVLGVLNGIITYILKLLYQKLGNKASLKTGISVLSAVFAMKLGKKEENYDINLSEDL